jgi:F-type H+-transporting ATPase subunit b
VDINSTLLGQIIAFALFVWFCKVFVWPLIMEVIEERETQIADGLAAADKGSRALEEAEKERILAAAAAEVEQEVSRAREELRGQVASIAIAGATKIIAKEIDAAAHKELLDSLAAQI